MKIVKKLLGPALLISLSIGIVYLLWFWYAGVYQRCDHRIFTLHITSIRRFNPETKLYEGKGLYTYPPDQRGSELVFGTPRPFQIGEYLDQCINLNLHKENIHSNDETATTTEPYFYE